jgi:hypothetical protein
MLVNLAKCKIMIKGNIHCVKAWTFQTNKLLGLSVTIDNGVKMIYRSIQSVIAGSILLLSGCSTMQINVPDNIAVVMPENNISSDLIIHIPEKTKTYTVKAQAGIVSVNFNIGKGINKLAPELADKIFQEVKIVEEIPKELNGNEIAINIVIDNVTVEPGFSTLSSSTASVRLIAELYKKSSTDKIELVGISEVTISPKIAVPLTYNDNNYFNALNQACIDATSQALSDLFRKINYEITK